MRLLLLLLLGLGSCAPSGLTTQPETPPVPLVIHAIHLSPQPDVGQEIHFTAAVVSGDSLLSYLWDFGDGQTSQDPAPSHTYDQAGDYQVHLTLIAAPDTAHYKLSVAVSDYYCGDIIELNTVFFERNRTTSSPQTQERLDENLALLLRCPNMTIAIIGFSDRRERQYQLLARQRAEAVRDYFAVNGIDSTRMQAMVPMVAENEYAHGDPALNRRVEVIPGQIP